MLACIRHPVPRVKGLRQQSGLAQGQSQDAAAQTKAEKEAEEAKKKEAQAATGGAPEPHYDDAYAPEPPPKGPRIGG